MNTITMTHTAAQKKHALITDGTNGIGYEIAWLRARDGYHLMFVLMPVTRSAKGLQNTAQEPNYKEAKLYELVEVANAGYGGLPKAAPSAITFIPERTGEDKRESGKQTGDVDQQGGHLHESH